VVSGSTPVMPPTISSLSNRSFVVLCGAVCQASETAVSLFRLPSQWNFSMS
jgi:hypothetical protein